jgi:hypothetical protein
MEDKQVEEKPEINVNEKGGFVLVHNTGLLYTVGALLYIVLGGLALKYQIMPFVCFAKEMILAGVILIAMLIPYYLEIVNRTKK